MSEKFTLFVVFLLFSYHACGARSFGEIAHNSISHENEKLNPARVSMQPTDKKDASRDTITEEETSRLGKGEANSEPKYEQKPRKDHQAKGGRVEASGTQRSEAKASVTWRVPHEKGGQPEAGFNLDYLPPKTHPPVHN